MITLLLDSSATHLSVAFGHDNRVIAQSHYYAWQNQSELLIPEIVKLLEEHEFRFADIEGVVVAVGPGSYTGVRIALTIAKIIGFSLKIPVYKASSLAILRCGNRPTVCLVNARSGRSYIGVYQGLTPLLEDTVMTNEEVHRYIEEHPDYAIAGQLDYLGLSGGDSDLFVNLLATAVPASLVSDIHALKPVYLKE